MSLFHFWPLVPQVTMWDKWAKISPKPDSASYFLNFSLFTWRLQISRNALAWHWALWFMSDTSAGFSMTWHKYVHVKFFYTYIFVANASSLWFAWKLLSHFLSCCQRMFIAYFCIRKNHLFNFDFDYEKLCSRPAAASAGPFLGSDTHKLHCHYQLGPLHGDRQN